MTGDKEDLERLDSAISRAIAELQRSDLDAHTRASLQKELAVLTEMRLEISKQGGRRRLN
jgi:hypothetical protein